MAKEPCICVLCGKECGFFERSYIAFYGTEQTACSTCEQIYRKASTEQRQALQKQIFSSPHLKKRELTLERFEQKQQEQQALQEKQRKQEQLLLERPTRQKEALRCCDREMVSEGVSQFQLGEHTFFGGDFSHLMAGSMSLAVYRCECCGQIKFFDPSYLSNP